MAFTALTSGQTDADSPLDQTLMDLIRTNFDDVDSRLNGLAKTKIIDIGDWDMVASTSVNVAHGLILANIRFISAFIRDDNNANYWRLDRGSSVGDMRQQGQAVSAGATNITLWRLNVGQFDNTLYDSTSYNRGWIIVWYV